MSETTPISEEPVVAPASAEESAEATISVPEAASAVDMTLPAGEKMLAVLGYIGFFCVLPLALKPKSEICQHHGKQALAVTLMFFVASAVTFNLAALLQSAPLMYLTLVIKVAWTATAILGIMGATAGKKTKIPFFSTVAQKFTW